MNSRRRNKEKKDYISLPTQIPKLASPIISYRAPNRGLQTHDAKRGPGVCGFELGQIQAFWS